jgi:hypothetical protein
MSSIQSKNRMNHGDVITQELKPNHERHRRWMAIYPMVDERLGKKYKGIEYKIIDFELAVHLVDESFSEEDKKELKEYLVTPDAELSKLLAEVGVDAKNFDIPWRNDYPL